MLVCKSLKFVISSSLITQKTNTIEKLEVYCNPGENKVLNSFHFWNIPFVKPFDMLLTKLHSCAALWNFNEEDQIIRDKIFFSVSGKLQESLLHETSLD